MTVAKQNLAYSLPGNVKLRHVASPLLTWLAQITMLESKHIAPGRIRSSAFKRVHAIFSEEEKENFLIREEERDLAGRPSIRDINLTARTLKAFSRFGVKTVDGMQEMLDREARPYRIGDEVYAQAKEAMNAYRQEHPDQFTQS